MNRITFEVRQNCDELYNAIFIWISDNVCIKLSDTNELENVITQLKNIKEEIKLNYEI